jgi:hypothetical protein
VEAAVYEELQRLDHHKAESFLLGAPERSANSSVSDWERFVDARCAKLDGIINEFRRRS